jgi:RNA polymerase sigma factor (sigma-70 family)
VEASALRQPAALPALAGRSPLLRLQSDERLIALTRRGHHGAFEALVQRYQPRLLAFCRHMLGSQEDAEDVLQEVFAAAFNAVRADDRHINARPWLYRIARNRSLNHLRRPQPTGQDSMDIFERDGGTTTADTVHKREEFRQIVSDVHGLPETQRTALLLREIDALSYDQIAETMDTTVPSVKSLLVRARVSLAEAAEARLLTCAEVRVELGQVAEGLTRTTAPVRRHLKVCDRCRAFRGELRKTTRALAAIYPIGPLVLLKGWLAKTGVGGAGAAGAGAAATGSGAAGTGMAGVAATAAGGITAGGAVSAGVSTLASKAAAGMAAAVIVTAGAVEVKHVSERHASPPAQVAAAPAAALPAAPPPAARPAATPARHAEPEAEAVPEPVAVEPDLPAAPAPIEYVEEPPLPPVQEEGSTATLPPREDEPAEPTAPPGEPAEPTTDPSAEGIVGTQPAPAAPPAGEPAGTSDPPPPPPPPPPPAP